MIANVVDVHVKHEGETVTWQVQDTLLPYTQG